MVSSLPIVLKNTNILLIGAGSVAKQKHDVLVANGFEPKIIATQNLKELPDVIEKDISQDDFEGIDVVIDATGSDAVREIVLKAKNEKGFLLNRVDIPEDCDFYFASLINYGDVKVSVSTNGASPTLGQELRDFIGRLLPKGIEELANQKKQDRANGIIDVKKTKDETRTLLAHVYLVGCGIGDVELLTLKAYKIIQSVDVVFVDHLISDEIIDIIPKDTKQIYVGKSKGIRSFKQEKINELLLEYAQKGLRVARLKSGDPYIFGRGSEEAMFLAEHGVKVDVIAGISSAIAGPLSAGIAPTARGYATNLSIVSAHLKGNRINLEWIELLKMKNHTTVVLMAVSRAESIVKKALEIGADRDMPSAVISNASRANQEVRITTLQNLPEVAKDAPRPAIIVFGDVVNLYTKLPVS